MNQKTRIIYLLRQRGQSGMYNYEFPGQFILRAAARVEELREEGYNIKTEQVSKGKWKYILIENKVSKPSWQDLKRKEKREELESTMESLF